jgi:PHD-finger
VFAKLGMAAPPGKYEKEVEKCFAKAEEALKNEKERVQVDESVEKKDLVAGLLAPLKITLPQLCDAPPDQPSCVPYSEFKLKRIDAFYSSWMDCCFTCGSNGASDTFLLCVDCGEAFHSFCVSAPIHSMELSSVSGWRCPNCKICEISGDVPSDEARMLYCEMCDRGFSLDLLDPPLEGAPDGLWLCGQCVDCKVCGNTKERVNVANRDAEPSSVTDKRFWSQNPDKCYRCGGCNDALDESFERLECQVCAGLLRHDDVNVIDCSECLGKVHVSCDSRAEEYVTRESSASGSEKKVILQVCSDTFWFDELFRSSHPFYGRRQVSIFVLPVANRRQLLQITR